MANERNVLVVDDSRLTRMMISRIVEDSYPDWNIVEAEDASQAINLCSDNSFDFITLDLNMPGMNGFEALPILRESQPAAKIGIFTANIQKSMKQKSEAEKVDFVEKPISAEKVINFFR